MWWHSENFFFFPLKELYQVSPKGSSSIVSELTDSCQQCVHTFKSSAMPSMFSINRTEILLWQSILPLKYQSKSFCCCCCFSYSYTSTKGVSNAMLDTDHYHNMQISKELYESMKFAGKQSTEFWLASPLPLQLTFRDNKHLLVSHPS